MSLDKLTKEVNKKYKTELMVKGSKIKQMQRWSSGSIALDFELGGGLPTGKIITVVGHYSDGKTSIVLKATGEYQRAFPEKEVLWIDAEGCWDDAWSTTLGVDADSVYVVQPEFQQQAFDIINKAIEHDVGLVVVDSVAALVPKEEAEASFEDWNIGLAARINSKAMRGFQSTLNSRATSNDVAVPPTIILINQMREAIGGGPYKTETEPGGKAIGFHSAIKIYLKRGDFYPKPKTNWSGDVQPKAQQIKFFIEKNKTAPPRRTGHLWYYFDDLDEVRRKGTIDQVEEIFRYAKMYDIVQQRGGYYDIILPGRDTKTFQGSTAAAHYIRTSPEVWQSIRSELMARIERSYSASGEEQEVADTPEPATNEEAGAASSEADEGGANFWFGSDAVGEAGPEDKAVANTA